MINTYLFYVKPPGNDPITIPENLGAAKIPIEELIEVINRRPKSELYFIGSKTFVDEKQMVLFRMENGNVRVWVKDRLEDY